MNDASRAASQAAAIRGEEHWTSKDGTVKLFMFEKCGDDPNSAAGTVLFVHGSSMASQPTFDLQVDGRPDSSVMDWFARRAFDCWCVDMEGYGRSTKDRDNNAPIAQGADDCFAAATYIQQLRGKRPLLVYDPAGPDLSGVMQSTDAETLPVRSRWSRHEVVKTSAQQACRRNGRSPPDRRIDYAGFVRQCGQ
jgi:pimeloyl-ACP methyl ester carboxylesterase